LFSFFEKIRVGPFSFSKGSNPIMPTKYSLKTYIAGGFYHIYNRGVEKRRIFLDDQDYRVFLYYFKIYLSSKEVILNEIKVDMTLTEEEKAEKIIEISRLNNFYKKIDLICFVLMNNHYHLLLRQEEKNCIEMFMRSLNTKYVKYFNFKYQRVGPLFQSRYKGVLIEKEDYFLHISRYIHLNPLEILSSEKNLVSYPWSSYSAYLRKQNITWINKTYLKEYFKKFNGFNFNSYQGFVEGYKEQEEEKTNYRKILFDLEQ